MNDLFGNIFNEFNLKYSHSWLTKTCSLIHQQTLHILKGKDLTVNSFKEDISLVFSDQNAWILINWLHVLHLFY